MFFFLLATFLFLYRPLNDSNSSPFTDPCLIVSPKQLIQFDPSHRQTADYKGPKTAQNVTTARIFSTFFGIYLFDANSDMIVNLMQHGEGREADAKAVLEIAEHALRRFHKDQSIVVETFATGYSDLERVRGSRYVLQIKGHDKAGKREDIVAVQRLLDGTCAVGVRKVKDKTETVWLVVPYTTREKRLRWFLQRFIQLSEKEVNVRLVVAVFKEQEGDAEKVRTIVRNLNIENAVKVVETQGDRTGFFSRAVSIREGVTSVVDGSLVFICDVDMYVFPMAIQNCRLNVVMGSQVWFPVFYSLYARNDRIDKDAGYWRSSSWGMSCMYKEDFEKVGGYDEAEGQFVGWGGEDVELGRKFIEDDRYEVFRAVEPGLRHKWHVKECEEMTSAYEDCVEMRFRQLGTMASVGKVMLKEGVDAQAVYGGKEEDESMTKVQVRREKAERRRQFLQQTHDLLSSDEQQ